MSLKKQPVFIGSKKHWVCNICNSIKPDNLFLRRKNTAPSYCRTCWTSYKRKYDGRDIQKAPLASPEQEHFIQLTIEELGL